MAVIDLRSDTITHPTGEMRRAMAEAEVGDDVFGEDPSINALQERAAEMLGQEAGLLTASGTMSNLIAALTWCSRGDEMIMGQEAHMFWNESGGPTALSGAQVRLVPNEANGRISAGSVAGAIRDASNIHVPATTLVCLENTHNRCSGGVMTPQDTREVVEVAHRRRRGGALGRGADLQRRGGLGGAGIGVDQGCGRRELLPLQSLVLPGGFRVVRLPGVHHAGAQMAQDGGRRHAPGRGAGRRRTRGAGHDG